VYGLPAAGRLLRPRRLCLYLGAERPSSLCLRVQAEEACDTCAEACKRELPCGHPCEAACHAGACDPCAGSFKRRCHGDHQTLVVRCAESAGKSPQAAAALLCCPLPCGKTLPSCPHQCTARYAAISIPTNQEVSRGFVGSA
jgi:hypothetical protein